MKKRAMYADRKTPTIRQLKNSLSYLHEYGVVKMLDGDKDFVKHIERCFVILWKYIENQLPKKG